MLLARFDGGYLIRILFGTEKDSSGGSAVLSTMSCSFFFFFFFCSFLAVLLELNNPGYSHYKSCCLDVRPQTGDRLCNLVSFSIPQGFMGRCLTLLAGYLLASLKATFFSAYLSFRHAHVQSVHACRYARKKKNQT